MRGSIIQQGISVESFNDEKDQFDKQYWNNRFRREKR